MLVIGFSKTDNYIFSHMLDNDQDKDEPQSIHDFLSKKSKGKKFDSIVLIENEDIIDTYVSGEDYDVDIRSEEEGDDDTDFIDKDDDLDDTDIFDVVDDE